MLPGTLLKDKVKRRTYVIYEGQCICGEMNFGETIHNMETRWLEHSTRNGISEPEKHWKLQIKFLTGRFYLAHLKTQRDG